MIGDSVRRLLRLAGLCALLSLPSGAAPQIRAILNAASYAQPGMPNSGIAQGSIFVVFGTELGPGNLRQATGFPLPATLGGTSIRVTVGATTVDALLVYVSAAQVAAVLPSGTPEGIGLMEVTYNGHAGQAGAFRVVRSSPGVLAQNQAGSGPALAQNFNSTADQPRNTLSRPARPGQVVTLWATGLGPIPDNDAAVPLPRDLNINLQVLVGGKPATVRYKGRSGCCSGVDQIVFEVPPGVSGCYVPLVVQIDNVASNFTTISVGGAEGGDCTDLSGISGSMLDLLQAGGSLRIGSIVLSASKSDFVTETGVGQFYQTGLTWLASQVSLGLPSPGSCMVNPVTPSVSGGPAIPLVGLDAGRVLNVTGPKGSRQILQRYGGMYSETFATGTLVQFLEPGTYTVDSAPGGVDVGPLHATITFPAELTSTVQQSTAGTIVNWRGGDPAGYVVVQGSAQSLAGVRTSFSCVERASAGQFAVPAYVLSSLPSSPTDIVALIAAGSSAQNRFKAPGLDLGYFSFCSPSSALCGGLSIYYFDF
ncbi:MAG: hypothetical protein JWP63_1247 [Candidatus Solibacter sp.]|nr:hypothetical protein [Candidatus Solibacter sp.]